MIPSGTAVSTNYPQLQPLICENNTTTQYTEHSNFGTTTYNSCMCGMQFTVHKQWTCRISDLINGLDTTCGQV